MAAAASSATLRPASSKSAALAASALMSNGNLPALSPQHGSILSPKGSQEQSNSASGADGTSVIAEEEKASDWEVVLAAYRHTLSRWTPLTIPGTDGEVLDLSNESHLDALARIAADGRFAPSLPDLLANGPAWVQPLGLNARKLHEQLFTASGAEQPAVAAAKQKDEKDEEEVVAQTSSGSSTATVAGGAGGAAAAATTAATAAADVLPASHWLPEFWGKLQCVLWYEVGRVCPPHIKFAVCGELKRLLERLEKQQLHERAKIAMASATARRTNVRVNMQNNVFASTKTSDLVAGAAFFFLYGTRDGTASITESIRRAVKRNGPWFNSHSGDGAATALDGPLNAPILEGWASAFEKHGTASPQDVLERIKITIIDVYDAEQASGHLTGDLEEFVWAPVGFTTGKRLTDLVSVTPTADQLLTCVRAAKSIHPEFGLKRLHKYVMRLHGNWVLSEKRLKKIMQENELQVTAPVSC